MIDVREIERLVAMELKEANEVYPLFASGHEAYAVIKEEVEEAEAEAKRVSMWLEVLWKDIKANEDDTARKYRVMREAALRQIQECIQVCAMCDKAVVSQLTGSMWR